jgi:hypothetical protein
METIHILNNEGITIIRKAIISYLNELNRYKQAQGNIPVITIKWLENEIKEAKKIYNKFSYVEIPYKTQEKLIKIAKSESKRLKKDKKSTKKD